MENKEFYESPHLQGKHKHIQVTAYVNKRGTLSRIKTLGFSPITLTVPSEYLTLGGAGKMVFLQNAYEEKSS